ESLVRLGDGGPEPPFFCFPGAMANVHATLGPLARHLGPERPVYALQDGPGVPAGVHAMAARYRREMRTVHDHGPYYLGGVCAGARVAFEMAQQLRAAGEEVAFLALVEPAPLRASYWGLLVDLGLRLTHRSGHHSSALRRLDGKERRAYLRLKFKLLADLWAARGYRPQPYRGSLHLLLTAESLGSERARWGDLARGGAHLHTIPGSHGSITGYLGAPLWDDHLRATAQTLRACMAALTWRSQAPQSGVPEPVRVSPRPA
ncbi:MAG: thioesterase domain-containing protein, partial [Candidatus Latescibacterota bacterium]